MNKKWILTVVLAGVFRLAFGQTNLIGNGGFELNPTTPWFFGAGPGSTPAIVSNLQGYSRSGVRFLLMGNINGAIQNVYQSITLPTNTAVAVLNYYWAVISADTMNVDTLSVWILGTNFNQLATVDVRSNSSAHNTYIQKTFDLTPYVGQSILVYYYATTNPTNGARTAFLIDDVSAWVATSAQLPVNDYFTNALVLNGMSATNYATNTFGTSEPGEPNQGGHSLWWTWTAPTNGIATINTAGSSFFTTLGVYTGSVVSNLTLVATNNGIFQSTGNAKISFPAITGTQYQIAVCGYNGVIGNVVLKLNLALDKTPPTVSITAPAANAKLTNSTVVVTGKASDAVAGGQVEYRLENAAGTNAYQTGVGTTNWTATVNSLLPGVNTVRVRAMDLSSNISPAVARSFSYIVPSQLTQTNIGSGTVSPNLNGQLLNVGFSYTITAKPASPAYLFAGWTGDVVSASTKLTFVMQSNMVLVADFVPNPFLPVTGNYQGLFYDTNGVSPDSSGFFSAAVKNTGGLSAKVQLGKSSYSLSGAFGLDGSYSNSIPRKGTNALSVQLQLDLAGNTLAGLISNGVWTAELLANRDIYSKTNLAPQNGKYTLLLPGAAASDQQPGGDSYGTVTVDTQGNISLSGSLADGTKISQKTFVSADGLWPLYATLYSGSGSLLGWLTFTNTSTNDIEGLVTWFKLPQTRAKYYPLGFTNQNDVVASRYLFTNNVPVLNFSTGQVWLVNGNLSQAFTNFVDLETNNKVIGTNKFTLTITTSSGLFKGSAPSPDTGKPISFNGVILQKQNYGGGYFLGTNQAGRVFFEQAP